MANDDSTPQSKTCTKCGKEKPLDAFAFAGKGYNARRNVGPRHAECRQCFQTFWRKQWRAKNIEKMRIYMCAYQQEHREEIALRMRNYKAMHRVQQANLQRNRAAKKKVLPDTFTHEQEQFCRQYFHYTCAYCGKEEGFLWCVAIDHFIPLDSPLCPGTIITNMLPACSGIDGCNLSKKNRDPYTWLTWKFGKRKADAILRKIEAYFAVASLRFP